MSDYRNLIWQGKLKRILYRETRYKGEATVILIKPQDEVKQTRFEIVLDDGGSYFPIFSADVPDRYVGKKVTLVESLQTKKGIKTNTQRLSAEGLPKICAELVWKN
jgi:hypothetical protein